MDQRTGPLPFLSASLVVGLCAAASRLLGFARDVLIASVFGTGVVADALLVGLRLPTLLRRTLAEGGGQGALVPWLVQEKNMRGEQEARRSSGGLLFLLGAAGLGLWLLVLLFAAPLLRLLAPGFAPESPEFDLAARCLVLAFPLVGASFLTAFATAWLSLKRAYLLAGLTALLVNGALVVVLIWIGQNTQAEAPHALWVARALAIAGLGQAVVLVWVVIRQTDGPRLSLSFFSWSRWRSFNAAGQAFLPSLCVSAAPQLAFLLVLGSATAWSGWSSQLVYAERLVQLPFGFIAAGLALVALPELSRLQGAEQHGDFVQHLAQSLFLALALALPAMLGLVLLAEPIIAVLFQHGAFSATQTTADAMRMLAVSLPFLVLARVFVQAFFAQQFYTAPMIASLAGLVAVPLLSPFARDGAELGLVFTAAMMIDCAVIIGFAVQKRLFSGGAVFVPLLLKLLLCNGLLLAGLWGFGQKLALMGLDAPDAMSRILPLALVIAGAIVLYALALSFCRLWPLLLVKNPSTTLHDA
jgi:putative peptidoglycan lipid II flippase